MTKSLSSVVSNETSPRMRSFHPTCLLGFLKRTTSTIPSSVEEGSRTLESEGVVVLVILFGSREIYAASAPSILCKYPVYTSVRSEERHKSVLSQAMPSHFRPSSISSSYSFCERSLSVSSIRTKKEPPCCLAYR